MPRINLRIINILLIISLICFSVAKRNRYAGVFSNALSLITEHHLYATEEDSRELFDAAMEGMVDTLHDKDRHSAYMPPEYFTEFNDRTKQHLCGVGIKIVFDEEQQRPKIFTPLPDSPAIEAGIVPGDIIMAIDGTDTDKMPLDGATKLLKGDPGTEVRLSLGRKDQDVPIEVRLTRRDIDLESVTGDARNAAGQWNFFLTSHPEIGYIRIESFGHKTFDELEEALATYDSHPVSSLIIDLRWNPGGLLDVANDTCDLFIDEGVIVSIHDKSNKELDRYEASSDKTNFPHDIPLVVLIDGNSASASEIVAACLQDHGRAAIAGERSYGKGTVQEIFPLEGGRSGLKLTISGFHRPNGQNIHRLARGPDGKLSDIWGVSPEPHLKVELDKEQFKQLLLDQESRNLLYPRGYPPHTPEKSRVEVDSQLRRAVEDLTKQ